MQICIYLLLAIDQKLCLLTSYRFAHLCLTRVMTSDLVIISGVLIFCYFVLIVVCCIIFFCQTNFLKVKILKDQERYYCDHYLLLARLYNLQSLFICYVSLVNYYALDDVASCSP